MPGPGDAVAVGEGDGLGVSVGVARARRSLSAWATASAPDSESGRAMAMDSAWTSLGRRRDRRPRRRVRLHLGDRPALAARIHRRASELRGRARGHGRESEGRRRHRQRPRRPRAIVPAHPLSARAHTRDHAPRPRHQATDSQLTPGSRPRAQRPLRDARGHASDGHAHDRPSRARCSPIRRP